MRLMTLALSSPSLIALPVLSAVLALSACNPTFNWREARVPDTALTALLPCKPEAANRPVALGALTVDMHMLGCKAGGVTFAVVYANVVVPGQPTAVTLDQWRVASLAAMKAQRVEVSAVKVAGAFSPPPQKVMTYGQLGHDAPLESQSVFFAQGTQLFQALLVGELLTAEVAEAFFSGLVVR